MGSIGDEALLGIVGIRELPERTFDATKHRVEDMSEFCELVLATFGEALGEIIRFDSTGRSDYLGDGTKRSAS